MVTCTLRLRFSSHLATRWADLQNPMSRFSQTQVSHFDSSLFACLKILSESCANGSEKLLSFAEPTVHSFSLL